MMSAEEALRLAVELADENARLGRGLPYGAVILKEGEVVATGTNDMTVDCDPTAHAEIQAIREACRVLGVTALPDCEMYASDQPCPMCMSAIRWSGIKQVYFARPPAPSFQKEWDALIPSVTMMDINLD